MTAWIQTPLRDLCRPAQYGYTESAGDHGTHRFVRITDIDEQGALKGTGVKYVSPSAAEVKKYLLAPGDLLIARSGSVGRAFLCGEVKDAVFASYLIRFRPNQSVIDPRFLFYFCHSPYYHRHIEQSARGAAIKNVNAVALGEVSVPVPGIPEQRRIVAKIQEAMARVDEIRAARAEVQQEAGALFASTLAALASEAWPRRPVGDVTTDIRNGWSGKERPDGVPARVLKLSCVHGLTIQPAESRDVRLGPADVGAFGVKKGEVFVVRGNGSRHLVGRSAIAEADLDNTIFNDLLIRCTPTPGLLEPRFLNFCLHLPDVRRQIEETAKTAAGIWKINQGGLASIRVPCPSVREQVRFVALASEARTCCRELVAEISEDTLGALSSAILRKAFAGEL